MIFPLNYIKLSPHRNCLEEYLKKELPKLQGSVLDVGSANRRYDWLLQQKPVAIDIKANKDKDVQLGDVNDLRFNDGSFDNIICLEVFEYIKSPQKAISEIYRVLKPGGRLVLSCPFMYKTHQDYLRFTADFWQNDLLKNFSAKEIKPIGNFYTIILDILRGKIAKLKFKPIKYILYLPYLFLVLFIPIFTISKDPVYASGYFITAQK
ncbi:MAG: class I SAM-dependent methyltransferase [Candidatus Pacebacteria bacterium]|nr:class I SAM-dependent methyltransferase [Candidatus Paceibacterota bacterium]